MRPSLIEAVEGLTERTVVTFMSAHDTEPDAAAEIFVLDRAVCPISRASLVAGAARARNRCRLRRGGRDRRRVLEPQQLPGVHGCSAAAHERVAGDLEHERG